MPWQTHEFRSADKKGRIAFMCFGKCTNYGDQVIPRLAVSLLNRYLESDLGFEFVDVRDVQVDLTQYAAVLFGPGGYITGKHEGDPPNLRRKWFLDFSSEDARALRRANVPFGFFGTGVNIWRNKRMHTPEVQREIGDVLSEASFVHLRGREDLRYVKSLARLDDERTRFQPCPSLFLSELLSLRAKPRRGNQVAINIAGDQLQDLYEVAVDEARNWAEAATRYYRQFAERFRHVTKHLVERGLSPVFVCNTKADYVFSQDYFGDFPVLPMYEIEDDMFPREELFTEFRFAIGMRLHGWLPFIGCGIPSLFVSTASLRQHMPEDLDLRELGCAIAERRDSFHEQLIARVDGMIQREDALVAHIAEVKRVMLEKSRENIRHISSVLAVVPRSDRSTSLIIPKHLKEAQAVYQARRSIKAKEHAAALAELVGVGGIEADYLRGVCHFNLGDHQSAVPLFESVLAQEAHPAHLPTLRTQAEKHLRASRDRVHPLFPARQALRKARHWVKASLLGRRSQPD